MTAEQLAAEFATRAVRYAGNLLILRPDDALALVRRAEAERIAVHGVDSFFLSAHETVAPLEHIADYSGAAARGNGCWADAANFIMQRRDLGLTFEVGLGQRIVAAV